MRVLMGLHHLTYGGIEVMLIRALPELKKHGVQIDFCLTGGDAEQDALAREQGCVLHRIPRQPFPWLSARHIARLVKREGYPIVHSHFGYTSGGYVLGARQAKSHAVLSLHAAEPTSLRPWQSRIGLRSVRQGYLAMHRKVIDRHADMVLGHSLANLDAWDSAWRQEPDRYRLVYNGVQWPERFISQQEARAMLDLDPDRPILLHVGSFRKLKNHHGLLRIFAAVRQQRPDAQLVLVGDGGLRPKIEQLARDIALSDAVRFEGARSDPWLYYRAADVFVFPSETEGFGNVIIEAQGAGLPVVASDIPAHRESVHSENRSCLFNVSDHHKASRLIVDRLNAKPDVDLISKQIQERFSISRFAADLAGVYKTLLDRS